MRKKPYGFVVSAQFFFSVLNETESSDKQIIILNPIKNID